ncbi:MAG: hypothetical protein JNK65_08285 [Deltaproteobacteria bacterium]|nr:hypothetical protein [Deltaproteobacteria bacterium]
MKTKLLFSIIFFFSVVISSHAAQVSYTYDALKRLTAVTYADGTQITYQYDAMGNRVQKKVVPAIQPPLLCASLPSGAISWWGNDQGGADLLGVNSASLMNGVQMTDAKVGKGFLFDGVDDFLLVPVSDSLNLTSQVSFEAWIKIDPDQPAQYPYIFAKNWSLPPGNDVIEQAGNSGYGMFINRASGKFQFRSIALLELFSNKSYTEIADGQFHHIALSFDNATARLYIDGVLDSERFSYGGGISSGYGNFNMGTYGENRLNAAYQTNISNFKGILDEPTLYQRALTAEEVQKIFQAGVNGKCKP